MIDTELGALATMVNVEIAAMVAANMARARNGQSMAYSDASFLELDCVRCLDAELRRRKVLETPKESGK